MMSTLSSLAAQQVVVATTCWAPVTTKLASWRLSVFSAVAGSAVSIEWKSGQKCNKMHIHRNKNIVALINYFFITLCGAVLRAAVFNASTGDKVVGLTRFLQWYSLAHPAWNVTCTNEIHLNDANFLNADYQYRQKNRLIQDYIIRHWMSR